MAKNTNDGNASDANGAVAGNPDDFFAGVEQPAIIDPIKILPGTGTGTGTGTPDATEGNGTPKKRGRPKGSTNSGTANTPKSSAKKAFDLDGLTSIFFSIHMMLAHLTKAPELQLSTDEAQNLAKAVNAVAAHYPVEASAKAMAWCQLSIVGASIYGPRVLALYMRQSAPAPSSGL